MNISGENDILRLGFWSDAGDHSVGGGFVVNEKTKGIQYILISMLM
jgi:hypothetical protein